MSSLLLQLLLPSPPGKLVCRTNTTVVDASHLGIWYTVWYFGRFHKHCNAKSFDDHSDAVYNMSRETDISKAIYHDFCLLMSWCQAFSFWNISVQCHYLLTNRGPDSEKCWVSSISEVQFQWSSENTGLLLNSWFSYTQQFTVNNNKHWQTSVIWLEDSHLTTLFSRHADYVKKVFQCVFSIEDPLKTKQIVQPYRNWYKRH